MPNCGKVRPRLRIDDVRSSAYGETERAANDQSSLYAELLRILAGELRREKRARFSRLSGA